MRTSFAILAFLLFLSYGLSAQDLGGRRDQFFEMAKRFELQVQTPAPTWALRRDEPLFRIAWLSDMHIQDAAGVELHRKLLQHLVAATHPLALLVTGDSWGMPNQSPVERQRRFREFLRSVAPDTPAIVLPGDNWPQGFEEVFGPSKFAFTLGGFRFICAAVDVAGRANGCSLYDEETLDWIEKEVSSAKRLVIFLQHEPIEPPCTLDAPRVAAILDKSPNAFLALGGHLHLDLAFTRGHWQQWIAPSTGRSHRPACKVLTFYNDAVIAQDWEYQPQTKSWQPVSKFLRARVPKALRDLPEYPDGFAPQDRTELPARAIRFDASLDARQQELTQRLLQFALQFVMRKKLQ